MQADPLSQKTYEDALKAHREAVAARVLKIKNEICELSEEHSGSDIIARLQTTLIILESGLFDPEFYLEKYPDICNTGDDPLSHYVCWGDSEGRQPNPAFFPGEYRLRNMPGVPVHCLALEHYIREGERKRLKVSSLFDPNAYLEANPSLAKFVDRPLFHFLKIGRLAKLNIRPIGRRQTSGGSGPRIAAYLGVKDEVELIDQSISHLRAIGVDHIMVCDMSSTDGTAEKLEKHRSDDLSILTLTNDAISGRTNEGDNWFSHAFRRYKNAPADWVLFLDADEFWLPASGNLKDCEALQVADALSVRRLNVVLGPNGPLIPKEISTDNYDQVLLFAKPIPDLHMHMQMQRQPDLSWLMGADGPKVMAKRTRIEGTIPGQHDVTNSEATLYRAKPNDLLIAHLALSTRTRFERKVRNICAIYEGEGIDLSLPEETWQNYPLAWHWRRLAAIAQAGGTIDEFMRNITSFERIDELRSEGAIKSAHEILAQGTINGW